MAKTRSDDWIDTINDIFRMERITSIRLQQVFENMGKLDFAHYTCTSIICLISLSFVFLFLSEVSIMNVLVLFIKFCCVSVSIPVCLHVFYWSLFASVLCIVTQLYDPLLQLF